MPEPNCMPHKPSKHLNEIEIIDGISSFDVMMTYLGIDPLEQGTVLLDANRLLLFQYGLEPTRLDWDYLELLK